MGQERAFADAIVTGEQKHRTQRGGLFVRGQSKPATLSYPRDRGQRGDSVGPCAWVGRSKEAEWLPLEQQRWGVENRTHHTLDVTYREDQSRVRQPNATLVLGIFRRLSSPTFDTGAMSGDVVAEILGKGDPRSLGLHYNSAIPTWLPSSEFTSLGGGCSPNSFFILHPPHQ